MLEVPRRNRIAERREATRAEILQVAWELAQEQGLTEFTLRDLAERVGMGAPSLYTHFASKHAICDAMFGQAWSEHEQIALTELADLPQAASRVPPATASARSVSLAGSPLGRGASGRGMPFFVLADVLEGETRPRDEVSYGLRDEDLRRAGQDSCRGRHRRAKSEV